MTKKTKALEALEWFRSAHGNIAATENYKAIETALQQAEKVDKCPDCGSTMIEVCSGLEKLSRDNCGSEIDKLNKEVDGLVRALENLDAACRDADCYEELSDRIDGSLLDAAQQAIAAFKEGK